MHLAACGNDCGACPRFTAKTEEELLSAARVWYQAGWRDRIVSAREIVCRGCGVQCPCRYGIIGCAAARELATCAQCPEYPCQRIRAAFKSAGDHRRSCREAVDPDWFAVLEKAFFEKKENLDALHKERIHTIEG